mgnify:FL=1
MKKKRDYLFNIAILDLYSIFVLYILLIMSVSKSKNLERKLDNFAKEAKNELNNVCGSSLWESLGFVFFDQLEDSEKIAKANFYYGQLQIINEIKFSIWIEFHIFKYVIFLKSILANLFLIIWT